MGKKDKAAGNLGRALIRDRFGHSRARRTTESSLLHTAEVADGYDWARLNLQSVTEESSFQEFLSTAELAGTEFQAEKLNITFVNPNSGIGLLSKEEREKIKDTQDKNKELLGIPRRPKWDQQTTPEQLQTEEREGFLEWRRRLALLQEADGLLLTPYEKNLEFWRQLWRVVERSDVVVQIVDARNPLLFRCQDLEKYVKEVSSHKVNLILLNKADFLSPAQRASWASYFEKQGVMVAFFSAMLSMEEGEAKCDEKEEKQPREEEEMTTDREAEEARESSDQVESTDCHNKDTKREVLEDTSQEMPVEGVAKRLVKVSFKEPLNSGENADHCDQSNARAAQGVEGSSSVDAHVVRNPSKLLSRVELMELFRGLHHDTKVTSGITTVGLVGYPNVGKSSTINALLRNKKVSVSATPGKTKHFQTLFLDKDLLLCDCPGLVMPSFVFTKAEMVVNGVLSIDQMRDHVPPVTLVASLIPRHVLEDTYGIMLVPPAEGEDMQRPPTAEELLNAYGYNRGFMTQNGLPDNPRSARYILKDFVNGKLLYCHAPPGYLPEEYHTFPPRQREMGNRMLTDSCSRMIKPHRITTEDVDKVFFKRTSEGVHVKGVPRNVGIQGSISGSSTSISTESLGKSKPWKDHRNKRNKREKLPVERPWRPPSRAASA